MQTRLDLLNCFLCFAPFTQDRDWLYHLLSEFVAHRRTSIWRVLLVELSMECLLELDDEVMEEPHVELVNEAVGCD